MNERSNPQWLAPLLASAGLIAIILMVSPPLIDAVHLALAAIALVTGFSLAHALKRRRPNHPAAPGAGLISRASTVSPVPFDLARGMNSWADEETLRRNLSAFLTDELHGSAWQVFGWDETGQSLRLIHAVPELAAGKVTCFAPASPVTTFFQSMPVAPLQFGEGAWERELNKLEAKARQQLSQFSPRWCWPLAMAGELAGFLMLGPKRTAGDYTAAELGALAAAAGQLAALLSMARLKEQVELAREMDFMGVMPRGMAHDLNNLLTPAATYLQLSARGLCAPDVNEELLPIALRNTETIRAYIKEALFFSATQASQISLKPLDETIRTAVELARPDLKRKELRVQIKCAPPFMAEFDEVLIHRLLRNLLSNSLEASSPGGEITIEASRWVKAETGGEWVQVCVRDQGSGISSQDLQRLFTPYFTTKKKESARQGFGLGLGICRQIIQLHGGELHLTSELGRGTTVQVDWPARARP